MYKIRGIIEGVAPILFHGWTAEAKRKLDEGITGGKMSIRDKEEEAKGYVHRDGNGGVCLPFKCFKACLLEGARMARLKETGRISIVPYLRATLFSASREFSFGREDVDYVDMDIVRIKGAPAIRRRPALNAGWLIPFTLVVYDDRRNPDQIKKALESAGLIVGLLDHRPEYGRFMVKEWEVDR